MSYLLKTNAHITSHKTDGAHDTMQGVKSGGRRGCDSMVVGFITTCAINTHHH